MEKTEIGGKTVRLIIGALSGAVAAVILALIFSLIFTLVPVSGSLITAAAYITAVASAFICGFISVLLLRCAGLVNGVISGICFFVLYSILSAIFGGTPFFSVTTFIMLAIILIMSALGGIAAVNIR